LIHPESARRAGKCGRRQAGGWQALFKASIAFAPGFEVVEASRRSVCRSA